MLYKDRKKEAPWPPNFQNQSMPYGRTLSSHASGFVEAHSCPTLRGRFNATEGSNRQVQRTTTNIWAAIGNSDCHSPAIVPVHHAQSRAKREVWVGGDHGFWVHALTIGHLLPGKAITMTIERSLRALTRRRSPH